MMRRVRARLRRLAADDSGQATVETAFALSTIIAVLMVAVAAIAVVAAHLAATDAAGQLARAHARDDADAVAAIGETLRTGTRVTVSPGADTVTVTVTMPMPLLDVTGRATALLEVAGAGRR